MLLIPHREKWPALPCGSSTAIDISRRRSWQQSTNHGAKRLVRGARCLVLLLLMVCRLRMGCTHMANARHAVCWFGRYAARRMGLAPGDAD
jgi:hypothetical protein